MKTANSRVHSIAFVIIISACILPVHGSPQIHDDHHKNVTNGKKITIIGTGYVGLVTGACLAEFGNSVICADIMPKKILMLKNNIIPIYEPGLEEVVSKNVQANRLTFSDDVPGAIRASDVIFIAVGTPMSENGAADMCYVEQVIATIAQNLNDYKVIVTKSTVPVGTGKWIKSVLEDKFTVSPALYDIVSNPEFLREGSAVGDFLHPDRVVLGTETNKAEKTMKQVYQQLISKDTPVVFTNVVSAETIKYASNAFLATKLSFINEMANLCDETGADISTITLAMGLDKRISPQFLQPGPGFGGSCFPKDTQALIYTGNKHGVAINTVQAALDTNEKQKRKPVEKLLKLMKNNITGKIIAVLGLAFKAKTDDVRYSPSISTIANLQECGAYVKAYDPVATANMKEIYPDLAYCSSLEETVKNADAIIIMTEWDEFKNMDLEHISSLVAQRIIVDARNILDTDALKKHGFIFDNIGKSFLSSFKSHVIGTRHI